MRTRVKAAEPRNRPTTGATAIAFGGHKRTGSGSAISTRTRLLHSSSGLPSAIGNQCIQRLLRTGAVQAKLTVSSPDDPYEQEADRVADQVMRMPASDGGSPRGGCFACAGGESPCPACAAEKRASVRRKHEPIADSGNVAAPDNILNALGPGQPLDPGTRAFMEPRFGRDFRYVRVHINGKAAESARAVNALAYTVGAHIVFGAGQYAPHTRQGRWLFAHELTHAAQQTAAETTRSGNEAGGLGGEAGEREADRQADRAATDSALRDSLQHLPPHVARFSVRGHHIVEEAGLAGAGFTPAEIEAIHRGNVQRDFSQVGTVGNTLLLCRPSNFGGYRPREHFDNFIWDAVNERWRTRGTARRYRHQDLNAFDPTPVDYIESELMTLADAGMSEKSLVHLGNAFHTVEDFFAHSNFVELVNQNFSISRELLTGSISGQDTSSLLHTIASVSEPRSAAHYRSQARAEEQRADPLSHARIAKDQPGHRYHEGARRLAALVIQDLGGEVRGVMRAGNAGTRRRRMTRRVMAGVRRYLRPPDKADPWWETLRTEDAGAIDRRLEAAERRAPETVSQCIFSPLANLEASRTSPFKIPLGVALPVEVGSGHVWIQGGLGIAEGPLPLDRSVPAITEERGPVPGGLFGGAQITGSF